MITIHFKIFLALMLSFVPLIYIHHTRTKKSGKSIFRRFFSLLESKSANIRVLSFGVNKFCRLIYEGMKTSDSFRKFFVLILFILTLTYQVTDTIATSYIAKTIVNATPQKTPELIARFGPLASTELATMTAFFFSLVLLRYKWADKLLLNLKNNRRFLLLFFVMILLLLFTSYFTVRNCIILAEIMTLVFYASLIYPNKEK